MSTDVATHRMGEHQEDEHQHEHQQDDDGATDLYADALDHPPYPDYFDEDEIELDDSLANIVVVDGVPVAKMSRFEKLCTVLRKCFSEYGTIVVDGMYVPTRAVAGSTTGEQETCGYAFIEYATPEEALAAVQQGNGRRLDAAHVFSVALHSDLRKFESMKTDFTPPSRSEFDLKSNLNSWMLDADARDQFVLRYGTQTQVYWHDPLRKTQEFGRSYIYGGEREAQNNKSWTEKYVAWSARGTYLVTFHEPGLVLWGGDQFTRIGRLVHGNVSHIHFSPHEKYALTYNHKTTQHKNDPQPPIIHVWDILTFKVQRSFELSGPQDESRWPFYRWSHDDAYFATYSADSISIYESSTMTLVDKKSIKVANVSSIAFSPSDNVLAYGIPSEGTQPATVALIDVPSKAIRREKHLFNVTDMTMHWQDQGDYMCALVTRRKAKKVTFTNLEIFRMRERDIPIDSIELDANVSAFAWEPSGTRFALLHTDNGRSKVSFSLYSVEGKKTVKLHTMTERQANRLLWSPSGNFIVLAGLDALKGQLEFFDADNRESLATNEHFNCNMVQWDPSGRHLLTGVVQKINDNNFRYSMDNGYRMWSTSGQLLISVPLEKAYQVLWRPRPPTVLSKAQRQALRKSFKDKYGRRFEQEDEAIRISQLQGAEKERADQLAQWRSYRAQCDATFHKQRAARRALRSGYASDDESGSVQVEEEVEEELSREEVVLA